MNKRSIIAYKSHKTIKEYEYCHFWICHGPHKSQNYKIKRLPPLQRPMAYTFHKTTRDEDHHNFWVLWWPTKAIKPPWKKITTSFGSIMAYKVIKPFENIMTNFGSTMAYKVIKPFENIMTNFGSTMAYKVIKPFENITTNFGFVMLHLRISNACHSRISPTTSY